MTLEVRLFESLRAVNPYARRLFNWESVSMMTIAELRRDIYYESQHIQFHSEEDRTTYFPDKAFVRDCLGSRRVLIGVTIPPPSQPEEPAEPRGVTVVLESSGSRMWLRWPLVEAWTVEHLIEWCSGARGGTTNFQLFFEHIPNVPLNPQHILRDCLMQCQTVILRRSLAVEQIQSQEYSFEEGSLPTTELRSVALSPISSQRPVKRNGVGVQPITSLLEDAEQSGEECGGTCTICLDLLRDGERVIARIKSCKHVFHTKCITDWFESKAMATCPLCRSTGAVASEIP